MEDKNFNQSGNNQLIPVHDTLSNDSNLNQKGSNRSSSDSLKGFQEVYIAKNPFECFNVKLRKVLIISSALWIGMRAVVFTIYLYAVLNTSSFLNVYLKLDFKNETQNYIRIICTLFCIKEIIYIVSIYVLLILGAVKKSKSRLKLWLILAGTHETLDLMGHFVLGIFFLKTPLLAFHLPFGIPYFLFLVYITLRLMNEIKMEEIKGSILVINKDDTKAKNVYPNTIPLRVENRQVFIGHHFLY